MFDIGASELLLTVIVAIVVIGPKDLPRALRMAGSWLAKIRRVSGHFRSGIEEMIRQAEMDEMEKKWREKNAEIMKETAGQAHSDPADPAAPQFVAGEVYPSPATAPDPAGYYPSEPDYPTTPVDGPVEGPAAASAEAAVPAADDRASSPELPLAAPKAQP